MNRSHLIENSKSGAINISTAFLYVILYTKEHWKLTYILKSYVAREWNTLKLSDFFAQKELAHEQRLKEQREQHKCNTCVYAQWIGIGKVYCMFPNCIKEDDTTQK